MTKFENIPEELKKLRQWVCWGVREDIQRTWHESAKRKKPFEYNLKLPFNPRNMKPALAGKPETWGSFEEAAKRVELGEAQGAGFEFHSAEYTGVDLDTVRDPETGRIAEDAQEIIEALDSYTEVSPSGYGVHIIVKGAAELTGHKGTLAKNGIERIDQKTGEYKQPEIEMYAEGRYFTMTGEVIRQGGTDTGVGRRALQRIHDQYMGKKQKTKKKGSAAGKEKPEEKQAGSDERLLSNEEILRRASAAGNKEKFTKLMAGEWQGSYLSRSEAEMALCSVLAFWTRCSASQMDELFRLSGLCEDKEKWERVGPGTIQKAVAGCTNMYDPNFYRDKAEDDFTVIQWPHMNKDGKPLKHWENTKWYCGQLGVVFRYNELTNSVEVRHRAFYGLTFDSMVTQLRGLCLEAGYSLTKADATDHIGRISEENRYHPVRDYLRECQEKWDGKRRIREAFDELILDPNSGQNVKFIFTLFQKWLITCVVLPFNDGTQAAQGVLVLIGSQGIGKTRYIFRLLPIPDWGKTGMMIDMRSRDTVIQALSYWIVELGEYGRSLRAEKMDHYKAFVTDSTDTFRVPYAKNAEKHPRTTVFYATTDENSFLRDSAGERRNWTIAVSGFKDNGIDKDQMWGEIMHMAFVEKCPHWLTAEEIATLNEQNADYKVHSAYFEMLYPQFDWEADKSEWLNLTATDICRLMGIEDSKNRHVARALMEMKLKRQSSSNSGPKLYVVPPFTEPYRHRSAVDRHNAHRYRSLKVIKDDSPGR